MSFTLFKAAMYLRKKKSQVFALPNVVILGSLTAVAFSWRKKKKSGFCHTNPRRKKVIRAGSPIRFCATRKRNLMCNRRLNFFTTERSPFVFTKKKCKVLQSITCYFYLLLFLRPRLIRSSHKSKFKCFTHRGS